MRISAAYSSVNYVQVAASRPRFEGRGSNPSPTQQINNAGRAAVAEQGKGARIDVRG